MTRFRVYWHSRDLSAVVLADTEDEAVSIARRERPEIVDDRMEPVVRYMMTVTEGLDEEYQRARIRGSLRAWKERRPLCV